MADIFQEVDEALRQDRAREWWTRHGTKVIAAAVLVVLAIAGWNGWHWYQTSQRAKASMAFTTAIEGLARDKDKAASVAALEKLTSGVEPYASLARLKLAQLKAEAGERPAAAAQFAAAAQAADSSDLKDLSVLLSAMQAFETASPEELEARLKPLAERNRPWRASALELLAAVAMKRNDPAAARALWSQLRDDPATPPAMRERAREMIVALGGDGGDKKN